jgi:hypothetical protein
MERPKGSGWRPARGARAGRLRTIGRWAPGACAAGTGGQWAFRTPGARSPFKTFRARLLRQVSNAEQRKANKRQSKKNPYLEFLSFPSFHPLSSSFFGMKIGSSSRTPGESRKRNGLLPFSEFGARLRKFRPPDPLLQEFGGKGIRSSRFKVFQPVQPVQVS